MKKLFLLLLMLLFSTQLFAEPVKKIIFFGDSLSDNGNFYRFNLHYLPKSPPYFQGRFTNGLTWADYLAKNYHDNYKIDSDNYAIGGSTVILRAPWKGCLPYDLGMEVHSYLTKTVLHPKQRANALFVFLMGANDYNSEFQQDPEALTNDVVNEIKNNIKNVINNGGRHFLIMDLPDLSQIPRMQGNPLAPRQALLSKLHLQKIQRMIDILKIQHPYATFSYFSLYDNLSDILTHLDKYNKKFHTHFTDTKTSCWLGGYTLQSNHKGELEKLKKELDLVAYPLAQSGLASTKTDTVALAHHILSSPDLAEAYQVGELKAQGVAACKNPDEHLFWDALHPTYQVHQILASLVEEQITKEGLITK